MSESFITSRRGVTLLPSCNGLMSTERLLDLACVAKPERDALLRVHRPDNIRLSDSMVIRDQRPMPPTALVRALDGGLDPERMERQQRACGDRPQVVLTFNADALFDRFAAEAFLSPINSGNARRKAPVAGRRLFFPTQAGCGRVGRRAGARVLQPKFCSVAPSLRRRRI